jgi:hypothetical protein
VFVEEGEEKPVRPKAAKAAIKQKAVEEDAPAEEEDEGAFGGPKPILPFSSLFILSPTNPLVK